MKTLKALVELMLMASPILIFIGYCVAGVIKHW